MQLEEKCQILELTVNRFFSRMQPLHQKGLLSLFVINDKLMDRGDYVKKLQGTAAYAANLCNVKGNIIGKALLEASINQIYIEHELKHVFLVKPSFSKYTDADEVYRRLTQIKIPNGEAWTEICDYQEERDKDDQSDHKGMSQHQPCQQNHFSKTNTSSINIPKKEGHLSQFSQRGHSMATLVILPFIVINNRFPSVQRQIVVVFV